METARSAPSTDQYEFHMVWAKRDADTAPFAGRADKVSRINHEGRRYLFQGRGNPEFEERALKGSLQHAANLADPAITQITVRGKISERNDSYNINYSFRRRN